MTQLGEKMRICYRI